MAKMPIKPITLSAWPNREGILVVKRKKSYHLDKPKVKTIGAGRILVVGQLLPA